MSAFLRKYALGTVASAGTSDVCIPMVKRGLVDFAVGADWTPAAGDVQISKDGGAAANIGTLPVAVAMNNGAYWKFVFSNAELTCKKFIVTIVDSATKAVEDNAFDVETYGNASAMHPFDLASPTVAVGTDGIGAASISTAGYTALGASMGGAIDDSFLTDHTIAGTLAKAIADIQTAVTTTGVPINAAGLLAVLAAAIAEPTGPISWPASMGEILAWVGALGQNQMADSGDTITVRNAANTATIGTASVVDDGTTTTRSAWS